MQAQAHTTWYGLFHMNYASSSSRYIIAILSADIEFSVYTDTPGLKMSDDATQINFSMMSDYDDRAYKNAASA